MVNTDERQMGNVLPIIQWVHIRAVCTSEKLTFSLLLDDALSKQTALPQDGQKGRGLPSDV